MTQQGDNPFAEPDDDDQTVIVPREALSALAARREAVGVESQRAPADNGDFAALPAGSGSPVTAAASPLLSLIARLRNVANVPDPLALRERTMQELRHYEAALREAKVPPEHLRLGHYVLCTSLDDVVQCTPWGSHGPWAEHSLTSQFHKDVRGGERFFDILAKLLASPTQFLPLIELMYLCMSLGMHGQYRTSPRGPAELDRVREETYAVIRRLSGPAPQELSPHWRGLGVPFRPLRFEMPLWLAALIGIGLFALAYGLFVYGLASQSDQVFNAADTLPPAGMPAIVRAGPPLPPPPMPERPGLRSRLLALLADDIHDGRLFVEGTESIPILRLQSEEMFALGEATVLPRYLPVLHRIGDALGHEGVSMQVIGYTDSQPIHTLAFPSNYDLSLARARAAAAVVTAGKKMDPKSLVIAGRGAQEPRGDNATPAGRAANRRVELIVESPATGAIRTDPDTD